MYAKWEVFKTDGVVSTTVGELSHCSSRLMIERCVLAAKASTTHMDREKVGQERTLHCQRSSMCCTGSPDASPAFPRSAPLHTARTLKSGILYKHQLPPAFPHRSRSDLKNKSFVFVRLVQRVALVNTAKRYRSTTGTRTQTGTVRRLSAPRCPVFRDDSWPAHNPATIWMTNIEERGTIQYQTVPTWSGYRLSGSTAALCRTTLSTQADCRSPILHCLKQYDHYFEHANNEN